MEVSESYILLVDDSKLTRKMMKEILIGLGFKHIRECEDGTDAQKELANRRYHAIISDWHMPAMSGLELLKHVREDLKKKKEDFPFIMVTSEGEKEQIIQAISIGVSDYIVKPFNHETVRNKLLPHFPSLKEG